MKSINITIDYKTHKSHNTYDPTYFYCPNCGEKKVYTEHGPGDYYVGTIHICIACAHGFYLPELPRDFSSGYSTDQQLIEQLRKAQSPNATGSATNKETK